MAISSLCRQSWTGNMGATQFTTLMENRTTTVDAFGYAKVTLLPNTTEGTPAQVIDLTPLVATNGSINFAAMLLQEVELVNLDSKERITCVISFNDVVNTVELEPKQRFVYSAATAWWVIPSNWNMSSYRTTKNVRKTKLGILITAITAP